VKTKDLTPKLAEKLLEDLRKGIPPVGRLELLTVGRNEEIEWLDNHLVDDEAYALLLKANYGSGKSHLLQLIREKALRECFAVSLVTLDAKSGVRFNRMDQIFGQIVRHIEIQMDDGNIGGLSHLLDYFVGCAEEARSEQGTEGYEFWKAVTNNWKWDYSEELKSPPLFIALRAWASSDSQDVRSLIIDWLTFPDNYNNQRALLYQKLVEGLRSHFRDPRPSFQMYKEGSLTFIPQLYSACWAALEDINRMCRITGLTGMTVLFDEFEDVLTNLNRVNWQEAAFWNLFRFVSGTRFSGKTFFAVTPSFVEKCKSCLNEKDRWDIDQSAFDSLPHFEMSPLTKKDLLQLAERIVEVHELAYDYEVEDSVLEEMQEKVALEAKSAVQDRARQAIRRAMEVLDDALD
jgi:hypothetical protein